MLQFVMHSMHYQDNSKIMCVKEEVMLKLIANLYMDT